MGTFDVTAFHRALDAVFAAHEGATHAEPLLLSALAESGQLQDDEARLSILNEIMGFYRSQSRHDDAVAASAEALSLAAELNIEGTDAYATTLINAATALRAAGHHDEALLTYQRALASAEKTMRPTDRRLAALHNNLSMLFSETQDPGRARAELTAALDILEASSVDPAGDLDIATTCTNLGLVCFTLGRDAEATAYLDRSSEIYRQGRHESDPHYASALAGQAEACFRTGRLADAEAMYRAALDVIAECYGTDNDYYEVTAANLAQVAAEARTVRGSVDEGVDAQPRADERPRMPSRPEPGRDGGQPADDGLADSLTGLALSRAFWEAHGPALLDRYPDHRGRIAVGLVGHGSECYGFDDATSRDHDFGPGFCLWLTQDDYGAIGADLQADYEALPREFGGVGARRETPRARDAGRRVGVFEIGDFYEQLTGHRRAPAADRPHEWLLLDEATLAAATNGAVFADPFGAFSAVRGGFRRMPKDVRLALVSRRLGMMAQAGQYNVPRMLGRGDGEAAWLAVSEFTTATASAVFLLNGPASAGYLPYYKWQFAALRRLGARMGSQLPGICADLSEVLRLASAACFGGAGFGEGGRGADPAQVGLIDAIERVCRQIGDDLRARRLSRSDDTFLERHRSFLSEHIDDEWLRTL